MELVFLGGLGVIMGIITSISGGAGVFAVPLLLAIGVPPINALALNKMSDVGVVFGAIRNYSKSKNIDWSLACRAAIPVGIGSYIGASMVLSLPQEYLKLVVLFGVLVGVFFLLKPARPNIEEEGGKTKPIGWVLLVFRGAWSGALGMAGGTFGVLVLVYFFRKNYLEARSTDIAIAIPEVLVSTTVLVLGSTLTWEPLVVMFSASFVGAWFGAKTAIKKGSPFVRHVMIFIAILMLIKVGFDIYSSFYLEK